MTTKGVINVSCEILVQPTIQSDLEGDNRWALTRQDGSASGVIFLILVIGPVRYIRECEGRRINVLHGCYILRVRALGFPILILGFGAPYLGF